MPFFLLLKNNSGPLFRAEIFAVMIVGFLLAGCHSAHIRIPEYCVGKIYLARGEFNVKLKNNADPIELADVVRLNLTGASISDDLLACICSLENLVELNLAHTNLDSSDLDYISELENLRKLNLRGTLVDEKGFHLILKFDSLEWVDLRDTRIPTEVIDHYIEKDGRIEIY